MTFKNLFEAKSRKPKNSLKNLEKILKKDGVLEIIDSRDLWVAIDDIVDGIGYGTDQFDNDVEINFSKDAYRLAD